MESNRKNKFVFKQPRTFEERCKLARILPERLEYRLPVAVDPLDGRAERAFAAWPERIYILETGGRIAYKAGPGPFGFKPKDAEKHLRQMLGAPRGEASPEASAAGRRT